MNSSNKPLSCADVKNRDMVDYLATLGFKPTRISRQHYWYISPLRNERTASFKVNRTINKWYDFGEGRGGNLIDFGILYFNCTIREFLNQFYNAGYSSLLPVLNRHEQQENEKEFAQIRSVKNLVSPPLLSYLNSRKVDTEIAKSYCKEVTFTMYDKSYYAIGFQNDSGGFELRNRFFKGSSQPKAITTIRNSTECLSIFEGFFDFLSYLTIYKNLESLLNNFIILNSLSFLPKIIPELSRYKAVNIFFDRDKMGQKGTSNLLSIGSDIKDRSYLYCHYKDLNDWLIHFGLTDKLSSENGCSMQQPD